LLLDTLDARMTQAVSAIDPLRDGHVGLWTQHTVAGGAGSVVRWYEIDPVNKTLLQSGAASSGRLYFFNGAISPDRVVSSFLGTGFGSNMVLGFNTSSASNFPAIKIVSKRGNDSQSRPTLVKASPGPDIDFSCVPPFGFGVCRWGDYAAATPDPARSPHAPNGRVYLTSQWTADGNKTGGTSGVSWRTFNWVAEP
jgi:hypothetical protein